VFGDPTYADAILDRLVHNAYRIELRGESMRRHSKATSDDEKDKTNKLLRSFIPVIHKAQNRPQQQQTRIYQ
jgi:hypothetical protein